MSFSDFTLKEYTDILAAKEPVPGGGGASAICAALGAALGTMVGNYTLGKKKYADVEPDIERIMEKTEALRAKLLILADKDAEAFEPLSRAYSIPKDDPNRDDVMEKCLRDAASAPFEILGVCCELIDLHKELEGKGSSLMVSDVGTGVVLCWSAMYGAALNVKVNTKLMKDREYADGINGKVDELIGKYWKIAEEVYELVYKRFL